MRKALIITTGGIITEKEFTNGNALVTLQEAVGGYIECATLTPHLLMWVNEEGKLKHMPVNELATWMYTRIFGPVDIILGNIILTGGTDPQGNTLGLSKSQASKITQELKGRKS